MAHVITILAHGFEEVEAITCIDLLRRAQIKVTVLGLDSPEVTGSHAITIKTEGLLADYSGDYDGIILPGGQPGTTNLANSALVIQKVKDAFSRGLLCAAICAAPSVLEKSGVLSGLKATCYPGVQQQFVTSNYIEAPVVCDKNVITSRGVGTAISFSLELISYLTDKATAEKVSKAILFS